MKVAELLEQFQDDPLEGDNPDTIGKYGMASQTRQNWAWEKRNALKTRDLALFYKLSDFFDEHPEDIFLQSHPSEYDSDPDGHFMNYPRNCQDMKLENPADFVEIHSQGVWFDEDLATRPHREEDEWDDVYETWFVRKSKPSFVRFVNNIIQLHQRIQVSQRNSWRWT